MRDQQLSHLISNTPMKLLTTIAAVLISISAYSQDYVEYDNGTFSQNGEQLSMEQAAHLIEEYQAGWQAQVNFRRGIRFNRRATHEGRRSRNLMGAGVGVYGLLSAGGAYGIGYLWANPLFGYPGDQEIATNYYLAGTAITALTVYSTVKISSIKYWQNKRDTSFNLVANKLNSIILRNQ